MSGRSRIFFQPRVEVGPGRRKIRCDTRRRSIEYVDCGHLQITNNCSQREADIESVFDGCIVIDLDCQSKSDIVGPAFEKRNQRRQRDIWPKWIVERLASEAERVESKVNRCSEAANTVVALLLQPIIFTLNAVAGDDESYPSRAGGCRGAEDRTNGCGPSGPCCFDCDRVGRWNWHATARLA